MPSDIRAGVSPFGETRTMPRSPSGVPGLDAVLGGGFPHGRTTIVMGGPGSGKTVLAMQYLVAGAVEFGEPGLMISFEESPAALKANFPGTSWPLEENPLNGVQLLDGRLPEESVEAGMFDLGGLVAIASSLVQQHGIKRLAIDGMDALFALSEHASNRRREILRVINWLTASGVSALLTIKGDEGEASSTGHFDLAEYAADGVLQLKTTPTGELSRRTLSMVKIRGATFAEGAHPYVISARGMRVLHALGRQRRVEPVATEARLSTGVERLDLMLLGGYRAGTTILLSGSPGASKTTLGAAFLAAGYRAGERGLYVGFDEPAEQMVADVRSVGIDLEDAVRSGLLRVESFAAGSVICDAHYLAIEHLVEEQRATRVVIDPISALDKAGGPDIADGIRDRLIALFKSRGIAGLFTAVADSHAGERELAHSRFSTTSDTWIHLGFSNRDGERNRTLTVLKARGTGHSNQIRELLLSSDGIDLADVYTSEGDVLVGTARAQRKQQDISDREAAAESVAAELETLDRESQDLARNLQDDQRRLDQLAVHRAEVVKRSAATGLAREREEDMTHSLRSGDADS